MEQDTKRKWRWGAIVLFIFGLAMLWEATQQTEPISIATALIVGGLLVFFMGRELFWKKR